MVTGQRFAVGLDSDGSTGLYGVVTLIDRLDDMLYLTRTDVCKETQPSHVHTQDGYLLVTHHACRTEEGTVTAHGDDKISIKSGTIKNTCHPHIHVLVLQEMKKLLLHRDFRLTLRETCQHLHDRYRLLGLVSVADNGKP